MNKLEIERKFLIDESTSLLTLSQVCENLEDILRISQTYVAPKARVRKSISSFGNKIFFHYNEKKKVKNLITDSMVHEELEHEISEKTYYELLKLSITDMQTIDKLRFVFNYKDQIFELDFFLNNLRGLIILEIELPNLEKEVELPPFLNITKEVSKDSAFTNFSLAGVKLI